MTTPGRPPGGYPSGSPSERREREIQRQLDAVNDYFPGWDVHEIFGGGWRCRPGLSSSAP